MVWSLEHINGGLCILKGASKIAVLDMQKLLIWRFPKIQLLVTKIDSISTARSLENINEDSHILKEDSKIIILYVLKENIQNINFLVAKLTGFLLEHGHYSDTSEPTKSQ